MLKLEVKGGELFDPATDSFISSKGGVLVLEHSLVSISKWESKWKVSFLNNTTPTREQTLDYIRFMTITQNVDPNIYYMLTQQQMKEISDYIADPMTATTVTDHEQQGRGKKQIITSELIYSWMVQLRIPFEAQKWHLNRLLMLIRVTAAAQQPPKKMGKKEAMSQQHALNMARRAKFHSHG